ncbi:MAG: hypothetical protein WC654_05440 [Patescibacteria group bacterium]
MSLCDPSAPPTFSEVYSLFDVSPRSARLGYAQARDRLAHQQGELRYAMANIALDSQRVLDTKAHIERAQQEEREAKQLLVLLADTTFRRELIALDTSWRRFRLSRPGAISNHFADLMMSDSQEQTADLYASWRSICSTIVSKATTVPNSTLAL